VEEARAWFGRPLPCCGQAEDGAPDPAGDMRAEEAWLAGYIWFDDAWLDG
jgi:hypothetical protein